MLAPAFFHSAALLNSLLCFPTRSAMPCVLQASMDKLVDTAVSLVEENRLQQAIQVLQQGIDLLTSTFPDRCARRLAGMHIWM
jgi:hypothetical protein